MVKSFKATATYMLIVAIIATGLLMFLSTYMKLFPSKSEEIATISYLTSAPRLSSVELNSSYQDWLPYKNERVVGANCYGYAKIVLDNTSDIDFVGFIYLISYLDMVYIFFFALDEKLRGRVLGSEI